MEVAIRCLVEYDPTRCSVGLCERIGDCVVNQLYGQPGTVTFDFSQAPKPDVTFEGGSLRAERSAAGLSQRVLGEIAGVAQSSISTAERGLKVPRPGTIAALAGALELPISTFYRLEPTETSD